MSNPFELQGIYYAADLPLSWTPLSQPQSSQEEQWQNNAVALLRALAVIETPVSEPERDTSSVTGKTMERLEAKLDLTLSLMMQLVRQQTELPPPCTVKLRAQTVEWVGASAPDPGQLVLVALHISPKLPQALALPARVVAVEAGAQGFRVRADFTRLNEEMENWLERTLFRYHRRSIQQSHARQPGDA